ncbi:protocadherin alpha-3-like isoform X6 [Denticeps clupeoides]|uniref:protocadherin alpha-3-like isoform X6 n=1 Tax=Denticeps clupeoides TaxID=299321 RepID=UPI0010A59257|nr:protocadherin alpha-3-like isoform X6 [Denticeps clupeoides]
MGEGGQRHGWIRRMALQWWFLMCSAERVLSQIKYTLPEEVKEGYVVGNISKDLGLDLSALAERRVRIVSGSKDALFRVDQDRGVLCVRGEIDREDLCSGNDACLLTLKVVVENPLAVHHVALEILDINDNSPAFPEKEQHFEIAEHTQAGTRFQLHAARDPDATTNAVRTYKLSHDDHFEIDVRKRDEDYTPFLVLRKALDRENKAKHQFRLTAVDGGNPSKSGNMNITVTVLDVNDNRPVFSQDPYLVTVEENIAIGTVVFTVNATDLDEGINGDVEYALAKTLQRKVYDVFQLDKITGQIRVIGEVDFEDTDIYKLDVQASDKGQPPLSAESRVIIKIQDVNDNQPDVEVTPLLNVVPEDSKPGTVIALISVTDSDSGVNGKVAISLSEGTPFELKPSFQDNMFSVVTSTRLDREDISRYDVTITATDFGHPPQASTKRLSVEVSDVNDNAPQFSQNPLDLYLAENNVPGASVFSVSATDRDLNENALITYTIWRGGDGAQDNMASFLSINSESGDVHALKSFDFESVKTFQFHVVAMDSGNPPLTGNLTINVFILDQNDNPPVILSPVSTNGSAESVEELPRNVNAGHLVTKVRAYDADIGYNGWLLYSLQEVSDHTLFGLDRYTGQVRTLRSFTETDEARHRVLVVVKDNGNVSLSATAALIVSVVEPKEAFAASDEKSAAKQQEEPDITFYLIVTLGSVSVLLLVSIGVLLAMQCSKSADCSSKYLQDSNYDGTLCHSIQYRSGDKRYMLVGPRMSIGSTIVPGSNGNTLVLPENRRNLAAEDCVYPGWILQHRASQAHSHTGMHADG